MDLRLFVCVCRVHQHVCHSHYVHCSVSGLPACVSQVIMYIVKCCFDLTVNAVFLSYVLVFRNNVYVVLYSLYG